MSASQSKMKKSISKEQNERDQKKQKEQRSRVDILAKNADAATARVLDHLAKLFSGHSECVVVCNISGTLYVAANEFHENTNPGTIGYKSISKLAKFFLEDYRKAKSEEEEQILKEICDGKNHFGKLSIPKELSGSKIIEVLLNGENTELPTLVKHYGKNAVAAASMSATCWRLFRSFEKIGKFVKAAPSDIATTSAATASSSVAAIGSNENTNHDQHQLPKEHTILVIEPGPKKKKNKKEAEEYHKVHAEVQILAQIVAMINRKEIKGKQVFYIGISKLCCLHCHVMIEKANEVFKAYDLQITITTRGHHDLDFTAWVSPQIFSKGYNQVESDDTSLEYRIGLESRKCIEILLNTTLKPSRTSMEHSPSDESDPESIDSFNIQQVLKQNLVFLQTIASKNPSSTLQGIIKNILIALEIHVLPAFKMFIESDFESKSISEAKDILGILLVEFNGKIKKVSAGEQEFLQVLQDPSFFGDKVSTYFKKISLDVGVTLVTTASSSSSGFTPLRSAIEAQTHKRKLAEESNVQKKLIAASSATAAHDVAADVSKNRSTNKRVKMEAVLPVAVKK